MNQIKNLIIINYKNPANNIILERKKKVYQRLPVISPQTSLHHKTNCRDVSCATRIGYTKIPKKIAHVTRAMIQKANQTRYHEMSILCLYSIN